MANVDTTIKWMTDKIGNITYSMINRNGPSSYDCSSSVYLALMAGGFLPSTLWVGNTDSLFNDLERHGWTKLSPDARGNYPTERGDVFIWGTRGASGGAFGHTGIFTDDSNIVHCSYGYNGMAISNHDWLYGIQGIPTLPFAFYRYTGSVSPDTDPNDQDVSVGSYVKFNKTYRADDVQFIDNLWQVQTNELCSVDFTWAENGIPAALLTEVNPNGLATADQELDVGSLYRIPGKFIVNDIGEHSGRWMAQLGHGGLSFWVDIETATEVDKNDPGVPVPANDVPQVTLPVTPAPIPTTPPAVPNPTPAPVPEVTPPVVQPVPEEDTPVVVSPTPDPNTPAIVTEVKTVVVNVLVTFVQAFVATWALTGYQLDKAALGAAIGASLSLVWNTVLKPFLIKMGKLKS